MLISPVRFGGTFVLHHVGRPGRWSDARAATGDPMDAAWRMVAVVRARAEELDPALQGRDDGGEGGEGGEGGRRR